ncbi:hypothetical protein DKQ62_16645 [Halomonas elongata]|uniref:hypothetical protein n=1 Tax=Halomonas elongata TaxID=2746 RepID=UPI000DCD76CD|nr:hypothetical protein DKQ62_16645 [Halomonas elongata]
MRVFSLLLGALVMAGLAGCSYHPARIDPAPAIVIDDDGRYHDRDWDRDRYHRDHRHRDYRHRDYRHRDRDYDRWDRDRDYRHHDRGRFCPPGQAKKGHC